MSNFYLDASAVVRYSLETGSGWMKSLTDPAAGHAIILSAMTLVEVAAALAAKHRKTGGITRQERDNAVALFISHCDAEYELIPVGRYVIERALELTQNYARRGYDAVQLATALLANEILLSAGLSPLIFVTADNDLLAAAGAEGLTVDNPNRHP